jgi:hypothetical protein
MTNRPGGAPPPVLLTTGSWLSNSPEFDTDTTDTINPPSSLVVNQNQIHYAPFYLPIGATVRKLWWLNGATVNGHIDVGIYREDLTRVISTGSTTQTGANVIQEVDIADTYLPPGRYYMAIVSDSATATLWRTTGPAGVYVKSLGTAQQTATFPLPDPAVPAATASGFTWVFGLAFRTLVA